MCQDLETQRDETRRQELASEGDFSPQVDEENLKPTGGQGAKDIAHLQSRDTRSGLGLAVGPMSACLILEIRKAGNGERP